MAKEFTQEDDALLAELGVEVETKKAVTHTPREERIIAGFEEIQRFAEEHGVAPSHGEERDIFERLYAVRLDRIRDLQECRYLVQPLDEQGLLTGSAKAPLTDAEEGALLREIDWYHGERLQEHEHRELCQCGTEKLIKRSTNPERMRAFLLVAVLLDQFVFTHFPKGSVEFKEIYQIPLLRQHGLRGCASASWMLNSRYFSASEEFWSALEKIAPAALADVKKWLERKNSSSAFEIETVLAREIITEFPLDCSAKLQEVFSLPRPSEELDDDALLAELGIEVVASPIMELKHVRSTAEKKAAEVVANRDKCEDFETFKPLFEQVQKELDSGLRETRKFELKAEIEPGRFFIVGGQKAYVAEMGELTLTDQGRTDARLRVIFDNGTESNMLMRSLQRSLNADGDAGRRITEPTAGPLFSDQTIDGDEASGTIYVLRSKSDHPLVAENRELVHKIGVTNMSVEKRIAGAQLQPTFLMANVEIVATYELYNINRTKLESLIHRIFEPARLEIEIMDRFGRPVVPREWFLVPLFVIKEAVERIKDGTISGYRYDPDSAALLRRG